MTRDVHARAIELEGVRVHNLRNVSLSIPLKRLTVITGVSGSGKSSLAFDTLFAEGQRRYIESFSPYARQFLDRLEKPDADRIGNLPPAIALRQRSGGYGGRSTLATATDLYDYLRLLFARAGQIVCPGCGRAVVRDTAESVLEWMQSLPGGTRLQLAFPLVPDDPEERREEIVPRLVEQGFRRVIAGGETIELGGGQNENTSLDSSAWVIVDRMTAGSTAEERIADSIELAFQHGEGRCAVFSAIPQRDAAEAPEAVTIDGRPWSVRQFSQRLACDDCDRVFLEPEPRLFSFNSPLGACPTCEGFGSVPASAPEKVAPGSSKTARSQMCPACRGDRLRPEALSVRIAGRNVAEVHRMLVGDAARFVAEVRAGLSKHLQRIARPMLSEMESRLEYLADVGIGYLTLDRGMRTLSGGEARRVALTTALGSSLVNMLYVLDEPSAGLHVKDNERVTGAIRRLCDRGNTVVVVEHEPAFIQAADHVVDIGPGAGQKGGRVLFAGPPSELAAAENSPTADYLAGRRRIESRPVDERRQPGGWLRLSGARHHNLKNVTVDFPLGVFCVVTGVSGSGKSTLVRETLYPAICEALGQPCEVSDRGPFERLTGAGQISEVVLIDDTPIGRTPRSIPATYLKIFNEIRAVFAQTPEAKLRHLSAAHFSFNSKEGGRCPKCEGSGTVEIDMQFLPDVTMTCPDCQGTRYQRNILDVKYRGMSIADVLAMTAADAFAFFRSQRKIQRRLKALRDVGLEYVPLGQPATTLSGGESQRLKLALHLADVGRPGGRRDAPRSISAPGAAPGSGSAGKLFLLEEPTTGLHPADVAVLLAALQQLVDVGHTLLVIEHNADVVRAADYAIELGPGAGDGGGTIVAAASRAEYVYPSRQWAVE